MTPSDRVRVLIAKIGVDAHDTGAVLVSRMLREAGMEVVYLGFYNTPAAVVQAAIEEDVDVIGISFHEKGYLKATADLMRIMGEKSCRSLVITGGIIKRTDVPQLERLGVARVFLPGSTRDEIVGFIQRAVLAGSGSSSLP